MSKIAVIYKSKYGATKKYAEWIAKALSADLFERKEIHQNNLNQYDTIIYGGGLYAGGISGINFITKNFEKIQNKNLVVFSCGLADPTNDVNIKNIQKGLDKVFSPEMKKKITCFHLRGGMDYTRLSLVHKSMMAMLCKMIAKKEQESLTVEEKEMLETYGKIVDFADENTIEPLVSFVRDASSNK